MPKHSNTIQFSLPSEYREKLESMALEGESTGVCAKKLILAVLDGQIEPSTPPSSEGEIQRLWEKVAELEARLNEPDALASMEAIAVFNKLNKEWPELFSEGANDEDVRRYFLKESIKVWGELRRLNQLIKGEETPIFKQRRKSVRRAESIPEPVSEPVSEPSNCLVELTFEDTLKVIQEQRAKKQRSGRIVMLLEAMGYPLPEGKEKWTASLVDALIKEHNL